jgi:hypothetical protein
MSRVIDSSKNILAFERWVVFQDLIETRAGAKEFQKVSHPDSHSANTRTPTTLGIVKLLFRVPGGSRIGVSPMDSRKMSNSCCLPGAAGGSPLLV